MKKLSFVCNVIFLVILVGCSSKQTPPVVTNISATVPAAKDPKVTALEQALEGVRKAPTFETYTQLGLAQLNIQDAGNALKSFTKSSLLKGTSAIPFNNICVANNNLKHWAAAIEACKKALSLDPNMQLAKNNLAYAESSLKKSSKLIASLEAKSLKAGPESDALLQLGLEYYNRGEFTKAISEWKRVPKTNKFWGLVQNNIGSAAIVTRDFSLAKQAIDEALSIEPNNTLYKNNKNWLATAQKEAAANPQ